MSAPIIHIFTDVGVKDTDDELLLKYLANNKIPMNLLVVFTGSEGISPGDALAYWIRTFESEVLQKLTPETTISYTTLSNYACSVRKVCDYALQIAPLNGYDGSNMTIEKKYIFAGDFVTPEGARPSFNRSGAEAILEKFHSEGKLIDISSAHMVNMRFNSELLSKFEGPFFDNIVFTGFLLIFARMSPNHSACKFAEGLINPNVGRGANYTSVMKMKDVFGFGDIVPDEHSVTSSKNYISTLVKNDVTLKDPEGSEKCLSEMNAVLQSISDKASSGSTWFNWSPNKPIFNGEVYVSDFDINSIPDTLQPVWEFFKKNSDKLIECFNPVYDLFAGYVLSGAIQGEDWSTHSPEEFLKNVVQEF